jgi:hypothetical protein
MKLGKSRDSIYKNNHADFVADRLKGFGLGKALKWPFQYIGSHIYREPYNALRRSPANLNFFCKLYYPDCITVYVLCIYVLYPLGDLTESDHTTDVTLYHKGPYKEMTS